MCILVSCFFYTNLCVSSFCVVETVRTYMYKYGVQVQVHTYIVLLLITYVCSYVSDFITGYYLIFIES